MTFIEKIWVGIYEDYQMRHFVQRVRVRAADAPDTYDVKSNVSVMYTDNDGHAHVLAVGTYEDRVRVSDLHARFLRKRVILDNFTTPATSSTRCKRPASRSTPCLDVCRTRPSSWSAPVSPAAAV